MCMAHREHRICIECERPFDVRVEAKLVRCPACRAAAAEAREVAIRERVEMERYVREARPRMEAMRRRRLAMIAEREAER